MDRTYNCNLMQREKQQQEQKAVLTKNSLIEDQEKWKPIQDIYLVTECCQSDYTKRTYKNNFNCFLRHIRIFDLQVLIDLGPKVLEQMMIKYVIYIKDNNKKLAGATIELDYAAIYHFLK